MTSTVNKGTRGMHLTAEIDFMKQEIQFLLNVLRNGYSSAVNREGIRRLDTYWKNFEESIGLLNMLKASIQLHEKRLKDFFYIRNTTSHRESTQSLMSQFEFIHSKVTKLKADFYEFMSGCNACHRHSC